MKKLKITTRDLKVFFLGIIVMLLIIIITDWKSVKKGFNEGWNSVQNTK